MQKTRLLPKVFLALIALLNFAFPWPVLAEGQNIVIRKTTEASNNPGAPRTPSTTIIEAYYDSELLSVCVYLSNAGDFVDVNFENLDTGETAYFYVAGTGGAILPISGNAGLWSVAFSLSNGDEYMGEFLL